MSSRTADATEGSTQNTTVEAIRSQLENFIAEQLGPDSAPRVGAVEPVSTGRSRENWLFELSWSDSTGEHTESLIARRDPDGGLIETDRATEFAILQALEGSGVPSPPARWLDADGAALGKPSLVMARLGGTCDYYLINGERPESERVDIAQRFCDLLAAVHQVDWRRAGFEQFLTDPGVDAASHELRYWQSVLERDRLESYPELALASRWLEQKAPPSPRTVLVHADFKAGNILLDDRDQITGLLDWELTHLGDPHEDLGWITQPLRRREHLIDDAWEPEHLFTRYESVTGHPVNRESVHWWNVFSTYKTAVMQVSGLRSFVEGRSDELYQPSAAVLVELLDTTVDR